MQIWKKNKVTSVGHEKLIWVKGWTAASSEMSQQAPLDSFLGHDKNYDAATSASNESNSQIYTFFQKHSFSAFVYPDCLSFYYYYFFETAYGYCSLY